MTSTITQLSIACQGPWAIVHAACPKGPILQAWDGKTIFCPCACHLDKDQASVVILEELDRADMDLTRASDLALRPGLEPREHGFIMSVLELRKALEGR